LVLTELGFALYHPFDGTIASLHALAICIFTTFFAGILVDSPVAEFLPVLAFRFERTSYSIPGW
jgi:hypothetical protein